MLHYGTHEPDEPEEPTRYRTGAHAHHAPVVLRYRRVFVPEYRKRVLTGALADLPEALADQTCEVRIPLSDWHTYGGSLQ